MQKAQEALRKEARLTDGSRPLEMRVKIGFLSSTCVSVCLCICRSLCMSIFLFVFLSACLFIYLSSEIDELLVEIFCILSKICSSGISHKNTTLIAVLKSNP